jgi:HEAT repeat protein
MEDVSPFATHFARLVWLLSHEPAEHDGQKEELRRALLQLAVQRQAVILRDIAFVASITEEITDPAVIGLRELAKRMAAHSVRLFEFDVAVPAREVVEVARAVASDPTPGDEGAAFDEKLLSLYLTGVTTHLGAAGFVRQATPGGLPAVSQAHMRTPPVMPKVPSPNRMDSPLTGPANEVQAMMQTHLMPVAGSNERAAELVQRLDSALESPNARIIVEDVVRATEELGAKGKWEDVVEVLERVHEHYASLHDGDVRRAFLMGLRRLQRPETLNGVTKLIPGHRELRERCTRLLGLAGEAGADVLIDNLIGSEMTGARRAYVEALRQCPAALKSLLHLLRDDRWYVVRNATALLGEIGPADADKQLADLMSHREARVRQAAAISLGKLGTSRSLLALLQGLNDQSPDVRMQAVLAIASQKNPRAVPWIIEALEHEQDVDVQGALLSALGAVPTEDGVARLVRAAEAGGMLLRKPLPLRLRAIEALAEAATPSARHALQGLQSDRDKDVRAAVQQAMGKMSA